jgi:uncharacterized membrane protein YgcG
MGDVKLGLLAIGGWLVAAVVTVGVSWSAISVVRDSVAPQTQVSRALPAPEETTGPTATATTSRPAPSPTAGAVLTKSGQGGQVSARCVNGRLEVRNITPRQGFRPESDDSGTEFQFRSSDHRTEIKVGCAGNLAQGTVEEHDSGGDGGGGAGGDDGGGDDRGGGGGSSGRGGGDDG